jgi:hypothetical protein
MSTELKDIMALSCEAELALFNHKEKEAIDVSLELM